MNQKGQSALETGFVVLLIAVAVSNIVAQTLAFNYSIEAMADSRAASQGLALELSLNGITTHLIRIDQNKVLSPLSVDLYVVSEYCTDQPEIDYLKDQFLHRLDPVEIGIFRCSPSLYTDSDLTP